MTGEVATNEPVDTSAPLIDVDQVPEKPAPAAEEKKTEEAKPADGAEETKPETPEQQEVKKESRRQRAIRRERDARVAAETENRILREQIAAKEAKAEPQDGEPQRDQFEDYETYLRAVTKYDAKQEAAATLKTEREANQGKERQTQQDAVQEARAKGWVEREKAFISATTDYEAMVGPYVDESLSELSEPTRNLIVDSEVGPQLLDHLARNPDIHDRIAGLSPLRQVAELAKLEDKFETAPAKAEGKKISTAPAPIKPTSGSQSTTTGYRENMTTKEYEEWRNKQAQH